MTRPIKQRCGARTRTGRPCRAPAWPNGRCRMHGGLSTGCRTAEGRALVTAAAKAYWARWRAERAHEAAPS
ncbi:HGGxSTG domain-containing protein [Hyphomicrobium zavarzinii]|uniref:HGGxSTG domain-containing protein n=1 Tax=Hyphomicrobium zavarzinii TaxID=48292 RepID=UPI002354AAD3|nr:HGGxSTG domain-containing protein [Hyphomicrobium zavarzinii]